ncbi:unnamed protein product, partial [Iphiclides podalirius]
MNESFGTADLEHKGIREVSLSATLTQSSAIVAAAGARCDVTRTIALSGRNSTFAERLSPREPKTASAGKLISVKRRDDPHPTFIRAEGNHQKAAVRAYRTHINVPACN